jgi:hypothetical protein
MLAATLSDKSPAVGSFQASTCACMRSSAMLQDTTGPACMTLGKGQDSLLVLLFEFFCACLQTCRTPGAYPSYTCWEFQFLWLVRPDMQVRGCFNDVGGWVVQ